MPITKYAISSASRENVISYINEKRSKGTFTVIDVGGSAFGWSAPYIDALVDLNPDAHTSYGYKRFMGDINQDSVWEKVKAWTEENGKFDLCICTHTLEDIRDPYFVCQKMSEIAKGGYVAIPSKYRELARFEFGPNGHRGYIHHRWIFDVKNNELVAYPKLPVIEFIADLDATATMDNEKCDLNMFWEDSLDLKLCNNDYMGPNAQAVVSYLASLKD